MLLLYYEHYKRYNITNYFNFIWQYECLISINNNYFHLQIYYKNKQ